MWCDAYCGDACEIKECNTKRAVCLHRASNTFTKEEARTRLVAGEVQFAHKFSTDGVGTGERFGAISSLSWRLAPQRRLLSRQSSFTK